jgi:hypothetical protein
MVVLRIGVDLDLFNIVGDKPIMVDEIAEKTKADPRLLRTTSSVTHA